MPVDQRREVSVSTAAEVDIGEDVCVDCQRTRWYVLGIHWWLGSLSSTEFELGERRQECGALIVGSLGVVHLGNRNRRGCAVRFG